VFKGLIDRVVFDYITFPVLQPYFCIEQWVLWVVAQCAWVIVSRLFEVTYRLPFNGNESVNSLITLRMKVVPFFETSEISLPAT